MLYFSQEQEILLKTLVEQRKKRAELLKKAVEQLKQIQDQNIKREKPILRKKSTILNLRKDSLWHSRFQLHESTETLDIVHVKTKVCFLKIIEINSKNSTFSGDILITMKWKTQDCEESLHNTWTPAIKIYNSINVKKVHGHISKIDNETVQQEVKVTGVYKMPMDFRMFPYDMQKLAVTIYTSEARAILSEDEEQLSSINWDGVKLNQMEWKLHNHVELTDSNPFQKKINQKYDLETITSSGNMANKLTAACHAIRRPGFYKYNVLGSILLLTIVSGSVYGVSPDGVQYRILCTLFVLMTAMSLRSNVASRLPTVSYFSLMDNYIFIQKVYLTVVVIIYALLTILPYVVDEELVRPLELATLGGEAIVQFILHVIFTLHYRRKYREQKTLIIKKDEEYMQKLKIQG